MNKVQVLFTEANSFPGRVIRLFDGSGWTHVSLVIGDYVYQTRSKEFITAIIFEYLLSEHSFRLRSKLLKLCVKKQLFKDVDLGVKHRIIDIECSDEKFKKIKKWCDLQLGEPFNCGKLLGTARFIGWILRFFKPQKTGYFCSQFVALALRSAGLLYLDVPTHKTALRHLDKALIPTVTKQHKRNPCSKKLLHSYQSY